MRLYSKAGVKHPQAGHGAHTRNASAQRLRQEDLEFKTSQSHITVPCLKEKKPQFNLNYLLRSSCFVKEKKLTSLLAVRYSAIHN
jgi:hypothetical protein